MAFIVFLVPFLLLLFASGSKGPGVFGTFALVFCALGMYVAWVSR